MALKLLKFIFPNKQGGIFAGVFTLATLFTAFSFSGYVVEPPFWARILVFPYFLTAKIYWQNDIVFYLLGMLIFPLAIWYIVGTIVFSLYDLLRKIFS